MDKNKRIAEIEKRLIEVEAEIKNCEGLLGGPACCPCCACSHVAAQNDLEKYEIERNSLLKELSELKGNMDD